jgi:hypothetical protein
VKELNKDEKDESQHNRDEKEEQKHLDEVVKEAIKHFKEIDNSNPYKEALKMMIVRGEYAPWKKMIGELQFSCLSFT